MNTSPKVNKFKTWQTFCFLVFLSTVPLWMNAIQQTSFSGIENYLLTCKMCNPKMQERRALPSSVTRALGHTTASLTGAPWVLSESRETGSGLDCRSCHKEQSNAKTSSLKMLQISSKDKEKPYGHTHYNICVSSVGHQLKRHSIQPGRWLSLTYLIPEMWLCPIS